MEQYPENPECQQGGRIDRYYHYICPRDIFPALHKIDEIYDLTCSKRPRQEEKLIVFECALKVSVKKIYKHVRYPARRAAQACDAAEQAGQPESRESVEKIIREACQYDERCVS